MSPPIHRSDLRDGILTYDLDVIGGVDLPSWIGHPAGVFAALLRRQVPQSQGPLLLAALTHLLLRQEPVVLQPDDLRPRVPAGHALEPHRAADRALYPPFSHFGWVGEAGANLVEKRGEPFRKFTVKKMSHKNLWALKRMNKLPRFYNSLFRNGRGSVRSDKSDSPQNS